jgi:hypothetical protein
MSADAQFTQEWVRNPRRAEGRIEPTEPTSHEKGDHHG